jgi:hypothetical protein
MTGSTLDLIVIAVVVVILLAAGIVLVFYADAHPVWRRPETPRRARHVRPGGSPAGLPEHSPAAAHRETRTSPPGSDTGAPDATLPGGKPTAAGTAPARAVPS